jgi:hypothetical protein
MKGTAAASPALAPKKRHTANFQGAAMNDPKLFDHINELASEEEVLWEQAGDGDGLDPAQIARLEAIKVELDRSYDLLHQRQARRAAGLDPNDASLRPAETVERYQQ